MVSIIDITSGNEKERYRWLIKKLVEVQKMEEIHRANAVIANSSVPDLFRDLIPHEQVPSDYRKVLNVHRPSLSSFIVWLGLNREIEGIKDYEIFIDQKDSPEAAYSACLSGDLANAGTGVTIYDNLYRGYSLPGTRSATVIHQRSPSFDNR